MGEVSFEGKKVTIWTLLVLLFTGGGYTGFDMAVDYAVEQGDKRWVTVISMDKKLRWDIEDELSQIQIKIDRGTSTTDDLIRKAVLEDRLRQLEN